MIIETMVAFFVSMMALVALLELSNKSANSSGLSNRSAVATAYADEGINWVKQQRISMTWGDFLAESNSGGLAYCLKSPPFSFTGGACNPSGDEISGTIFTRNLTMNRGTMNDAGGNSQVFVTAYITVTWSEGGRVEKIQRDSEFFNSY